VGKFAAPDNDEEVETGWGDDEDLDWGD